MKAKIKILAGTNRPKPSVDAQKWQSIDNRLRALEDEFAPLLLSLSNVERRQLLGVGSANESFIRDFFAVVKDHPELVPAALRTEEMRRSWELREEMAVRLWAVRALERQLMDTMSVAESDAYATALAGYQTLTRGMAATVGLQPMVTELRSHFANRVTRANRTRAAKRAASASAATGSTLAASPSSTPEPSSPPVRGGTDRVSVVA